LTLNDNGRFTLQTNGTRLLRTNGLSLSPSAVLDLFNNDLIVQATPANKAAMWAMVRDLIISGRNGGVSGTGIRSALAVANVLRSTNLAAVLNDRGDGTVIRSLFEGEAVTPESIMVKYTYNGDANQDGKVDADDYAAIDAGFANNRTGYQNGDFDYSGGKPDSDDYFLIDKAHFDQAAPLSGGAAAAALGEEAEAPMAPVAEAPVEQAPVAEAPAAAATETTSAPVETQARTERTRVITPAKKKAKKTRHHRHNDLLETPQTKALARWRGDWNAFGRN
jgi:hypothetical protein